MRERMIQANDATLCTEAVGDPGDPPILLMIGMSASMLWWEDGFCRRLADGGRFAAEARGARLLALDGAGHCVDPADWELVTDAILDHTREGAGPTR